MSDLVKKYQHYFNESVKLQETVNEQLAYIVELEEALLYLSEDDDLITDERSDELDAQIKNAKLAADKKALEAAERKREKEEHHEKNIYTFCTISFSLFNT